MTKISLWSFAKPLALEKKLRPNAFLMFNIDPKNGPAPKGKDRLPTIIFQMLSYGEASYIYIYHDFQAAGATTLVE